MEIRATFPPHHRSINIFIRKGPVLFRVFQVSMFRVSWDRAYSMLPLVLCGILASVETLRFWAGVATAGRVIKLTGGPPCETWSRACGHGDGLPAPGP